LLHEIYNGLFERDDWRVACKTPVGIIPAGSGNALAYSIAWEYKLSFGTNLIQQSALRAVHTRPVPMDIVLVEQKDYPVRYSFLSVGWGILSDIDIESERLRMLGEHRFAVWGLNRLAKLRLYRGRVSYLPAKGLSTSYELQGRFEKKQSILRRSTNLLNDPWSGNINNNYKRYHSISLSDSSTSGSTSISQNETDNCANWHHDWETETLPNLNDKVPDNWITIEDNFALFYAIFQSHMTGTMFMAPSSRLNDGVMYLCMIREEMFENKKIPKKTILEFIMKMETGDHIYIPGVEIIPATAFRLEPFKSSHDKGGYLTVDGELVKTEILQAMILPGMVRTLV